MFSGHVRLQSYRLVRASAIRMFGIGLTSLYATAVYHNLSIVIVYRE